MSSDRVSQKRCDRHLPKFKLRHQCSRETNIRTAWGQQRLLKLKFSQGKLLLSSAKFHSPPMNFLANFLTHYFSGLIFFMFKTKIKFEHFSDYGPVWLKDYSGLRPRCI